MTTSAKPATCLGIIATKLPFGRGKEVFSDDTIAAAMIKRRIHHIEVIALDGVSYRTQPGKHYSNKISKNYPTKEAEVVKIQPKNPVNFRPDLTPK